MNEIFEHNIKISIVGDSGCGKTSLMTKFTINEFNENITPTIGIDFRSKIININDKKIKIRIWDTAGQERFGEIIKTSYRDSDGVIITFDTTKYESFLHLKKWFDIVNNTINMDTQYSSIIIVGTKIDMIDKRQVNQEEIDNFISKNNLKYIEISSKDGNNIDLLFSTFTEMILEKIKDKPKKYLIYKQQEQIKVEDYCCIIM